MGRNRPSVEVAGGARRSTNDDFYLLSLIEIALRFNVRNERGAREKK
jgi:hypothetical protein